MFFLEIVVHISVSGDIIDNNLVVALQVEQQVQTNLYLYYITGII
jgi:hypothetical protein